MRKFKKSDILILHSTLVLLSEKGNYSRYLYEGVQAYEHLRKY